jgi:toxin FitB
MARVLLDTNIVSALVARPQDAALHAWYRRQEPRHVFPSAVTVAELLFGIRRLPMGRRRAEMQDWFDHDLMVVFGGRILAFDARAARRWADLMVSAERDGRRGDPLDAEIAAIAEVHGLAVATRNLKDLGFPGVRAFDPTASATP